MNRTLGYLALVLGSIGLAGCVAGLIAIWVARPSVLRASDELLDIMDDGLEIVEEKATQAAALVSKIQARLAPIANEIRKLTDKVKRTPEDERELGRIRDGLSEQLDQLDTLAETVKSANALFDKITRLGRSLGLPASRLSSGASPDDAQESSVLARAATKLRDVRESLATIREEQQIRKDLVDAVVGNVRDVTENLKLLGSKLDLMRQSSLDWRTDITELRTSVPSWTNWAAIVGTVILAWLGLGQFVLVRHARELVRRPVALNGSA